MLAQQHAGAVETGLEGGDGDVEGFGGFPEITLPSGLSEGGMPLGVQLVAGHFDEARLLAVAAWCESVMGVRLTPMTPND